MRRSGFFSPLRRHRFLPINRKSNQTQSPSRHNPNDLRRSGFFSPLRINRNRNRRHRFLTTLPPINRKSNQTQSPSRHNPNDLRRFYNNYGDSYVSGSEGSESGYESEESDGSKKSKKRSKKRNITKMFAKPQGRGLLILKMLKTKSPQKVYNILKKKSIKSGKKTWTKLSTIRTFKKFHM